jgi:UDP-N-acetylmuramoylalanine--D-glutamate ligase
MKIAILGYARQGQSAAEYFSQDKKNEITICDIKENIKLPKNYQKKLGKTYLDNLDEFDLIVRSPSIHPNNIVKSNDAKILEKVTTTTNIFFEVCPTKNIIGVTGTKGKGTTSTLISKMLEKAGYRVHLGGNIGLDPLQLLKENIKAQDWVVLELANFQLIDLKLSPRIAICLTFTPEHLDWHTNTNEYLQAKKQLFRWQKKDEIAIYYSANNYSTQIASASNGKQIPYLKKPGAIVENDLVKIDGKIICQRNEIKLIGDHNLQNICAAVTAVWQITQDIKSIKSAIETFSGLPHRIEFVKEINNIRFYNDSFATAQGATIAAINAIKENKVLILGGYDRGMDLNEIIAEIRLHKNDISNFVLIGSTANLLKKELSDNGFSNFTVVKSKEMKDIVKTAYSLAKPGEAVIFSPAFASFDMFKDFEDRGNQFKNQVMYL